MYEHFFGLSKRPFELTPDPGFLFLPPGHREALSNLEYGLSSAKSLTVLIGEAGTGKTTLLQAAFASDRCRAVTGVYLNNPTLTRQEFLAVVAGHVGLSRDAAESKATFLSELDSLLRRHRDQGRIVGLVVDEAQRLSVELLEEIRLLGNMETAAGKLLPLVLAGQPEFAARLEEPALRQLKQRVALRCRLVPFGLAETAEYIATRLRHAGGVPARLFTQEAVRAIHDHASGVPRTISVICDNALLTALALGRRPVDRTVVLEVCRDFELAPSDVLSDVADALPDVRRPPPRPVAPAWQHEGTADGRPILAEVPRRRGVSLIAGVRKWGVVRESR